MSFKNRAALIVLAATIVLPAAALAQGGVPGCTNLPDYNRALGALQGMTSACDMSVERARRIIAEHDGTPLATPETAPPAHPRRLRERAPQH